MAYFADPFASWYHGSNEKFNSLLRQCIPKKDPYRPWPEVNLK
jgi:IS30 family transposase